MNILSFYEDHITKKLTAAQVYTLKILLWLITVHKEVKIERLAAYFPLPILYESRRKHIQRFLALKSLSIPIFWFPLIKIIIEKLFSSSDELILALDRTQWQDNNILMISVIWNHRALPLYWKLLDKKGCSNLREQQAVIRPIFKLLKKYKIIIIGDREFHSVHLAYWLKGYEKQQVYFVLRQKKTTNIKQDSTYCPLKEIDIIKGVKHFLFNQKITKEKNVSTYNIFLYQKRKSKRKKVGEPWYIITNLTTAKKVKEIYKMRMGIEAMFKDCKTGGYNLEGSKANQQRLTNLILLIAISYTQSSIKGQLIKNKGYQKYISRLTEKGRNVRRHSSFWIGLYGTSWTISYTFIEDIVLNLMRINSHKLSFYKRGIRAMNEIESIFNI